MQIRTAQTGDLTQIRGIYDRAKAYMDASGNPNQWAAGHPQQEVLRQDIEQDRLYVCEEEGTLYGVFVFAVMEDPTYGYIDGAWKNDAPYGVIHRIASAGMKRGIFMRVLEFCKEKMAEQRIFNLRIDTHEDNKTMQHLVEKNGFLRCGIIYLENGSPRIAYQLELCGDER